MMIEKRLRANLLRRYERGNQNFCISEVQQCTKMVILFFKRFNQFVLIYLKSFYEIQPSRVLNYIWVKIKTPLFSSHKLQLTF